MCGIAGAIASNFTGNSAAAIARLAHRGPDSHGEKHIRCAAKDIWLGHTRLAILDISPAGQQPMQSRDGRWWISYNGEIYNHLRLRNSLPGPFRGHSDTETLLELIASEGLEAALPQLNGMFAFAALDTLTEQLFIVRDPFGIKPLYYSKAGDLFGFASEANALVDLGVPSMAPDIHAVEEFLSLRYLPSPNTLWQGIKRLQPGHILRVDISNMTVQKRFYIKPTRTQFPGSVDEAIVRYQEKLTKVVERQLLSDVPVGMLLSGGIDSALIAAIAKTTGHRLPCFSVGFGDEYASCEIEQARQTAATLNLPFTAIRISPEDMISALPEIVRSIEEPLGTTSIMPMHFLIQKARQEVGVVLTGQGSDEPWGGYRRYQVEMVRKLIPIPEFWRLIRRLSKMADRYLPDVMERGLRSLSETRLSDRAFEACSLFSAAERELLTGSSNSGEARQCMTQWVDWLSDAGCESVEQMMRVDTHMNLADDLLLYGDKITMANSLEARVPMLDIELIQFVESLPIKYRIALGRSKIVHKLMAKRYLPASIVHRRKRGFEVPFREWSRGPWRGYIEDVLLSPRAPHFTILNHKGVSALWNEHVSGRRDRSRQMFALLCLALWWQQF